jgi:pyruvate/2-oxoglutarate/acetoin dehydrogenase E1 component
VQTLTYAQAAQQALEQAMARDPSASWRWAKTWAAAACSASTAGCSSAFGAARVIDTPISEANIMGAAVGMALAGLRPVVEMRVIDFALCAMDEIVNQAAKNRFMFGGQGRVPLVARLPIGIWSASAAQHSQSLEAWFAHLPGLVVVTPGTPQDNFGLLKAALECGDPVIYLEHKELWGQTGAGRHHAGRAAGPREHAAPGSDLTIVTWSRGIEPCLQALDLPELQGVGVE